MNGYCLSDILVELVQSIALGKYILSDSPSTPKLTIEIGFYFYQHMNLPQEFQAYYSRKFGF